MRLFASCKRCVSMVLDKKLTSLIQFAALVAAIIMVAGCGTPNPLDYQMTCRDADAVEATPDLAGVTLPTQRKTIRVATFPAERKLLEDDPDENDLKKGHFKDVNKPKEASRVEKRIARAFDTQLEALLIQTPHLKMAPKADVVQALKLFEKFDNDKAVASAPIPNTDYLFIFDIASYYMDLEDTTTNYLAPGPAQSEGKYSAVTEFKVSVFSLLERRKESVKLMNGRSLSSSTSGGLGSPESQRGLVEASKNAACGLVYDFLLEHAPFGVTATRGEGRFALIDLGSDFGLRIGSKVEFYTISVNGDEKLKTPFAEGKVLKVDKDSAWVEVDNFRKVGVKINSFARKVARKRLAAQDPRPTSE